MHDPLGVRRLEPVGDLARDADAGRDRQPPFRQDAIE